MAGHGASQAEAPQREASQRGLDQERGETGPGVEEAEEAHQLLALPKVGDGLRLEDIVDERGERGGEGDHEGQIAEKGRAPDRGPSAARILRPFGSSPGGHPASHDEGTHGAGPTRQSQQKEQRALWEKGRRSLGADASHETAEGRGRGHLRQERLRRMGVEPFVEERPEGRDGDGTQDGRVEIEKDRRGSRLPAEQRPFREEQDSAQAQDDGNDASGAEPRQKAARRLGGGDGEDGRNSDEIGQARDREPREEEPVADGVRSHLLGDERRRGERRDELHPRFALHLAHSAASS